MSVYTFDNVSSPCAEFIKDVIGSQPEKLVPFNLSIFTVGTRSKAPEGIVNFFQDLLLQV